MRVISRKRLVDFWESRNTNDESAIAERDLSTWFKIVRNAEWANFGALRQTFGSADQVGDCVVFDVGNNRFRLIGRVRYGNQQKIYVLRVMDHAEYDRKRWVDDCGCHNPPPKKTTATKRASPKRKTPPKKRRGRK